MSNREEEVIANFIPRRRGARMTMREDTNQPIEQAPNMLTTQIDIARVCQVVAQLIQQQQT